MNEKQNGHAELIVGIDFDDVILDFNEHMHLFSNKKHGTTVGRADMVSYHLEQVWRCSPKECERRLGEFYVSDDHFNAPPLKGAVEVLSKLKARHELHIITSRGEYIKDHTLKWLDRNLANHFSSIIFTNQVFGPAEKMRRKSAICDELGVTVMIEDSMSQAREIVSPERRVLLLDAPWNQGELPVGVTRVRTWEEIARQLL